MCRGLFVVPVTWKEVTLEYILDTGADGWSTDPDSLERLKGKRYKNGKRVTLRNGEAGPLKLKKVKTRVHEMDHLALALGRHIDGIMGMNTFSEVMLELDYPGRQVRAGSGSLPEEDGRQVLKDYGKSRPFIRLDLDGKGVPLLIDSGFTGALDLHEDDPLSWAFEPTMVHVAVRYSEVQLQYAGRLAMDLQIGPLSLPGPVTGTTDGTRLLGAEVLQYLQLTFDRQARRVQILAPDTQTVDLPSYRSWGLGLRPRRNGLEITGVFSGTPAESAGLKKGDLLTHIDGVFVHERGCRGVNEEVPDRALMTIQRDDTALDVEVASAILVP